MPSYWDGNSASFSYIEAFFDHDLTTAPVKPMGEGSYYGADLDMLSSLMTEVLKEHGTTMEEYVNEFLMEPLGIANWFFWDIGMHCSEEVKDKLVEMSFSEISEAPLFTDPTYSWEGFTNEATGYTPGPNAFGSEYPDAGFGHNHGQIGDPCSEESMSAKHLSLIHI